MAPARRAVDHHVIRVDDSFALVSSRDAFDRERPMRRECPACTVSIVAITPPGGCAAACGSWVTMSTVPRVGGDSVRAWSGTPRVEGGGFGDVGGSRAGTCVGADKVGVSECRMKHRRASSVSRRSPTVEIERVGDVLSHGQRREQVVALEDETDLGSPQQSELLVGERRSVARWRDPRSRSSPPSVSRVDF